MKTGFDCLEGQRPRLTHFSTTATPNRSQTALTPIPLDPPASHANKNDFAFHDFANPETPLRG
jgi:hypothetical protein